MNEGERYMRFLLAGGSSALLNSATRWVLNLFMSFELAVALAYLVGMASAYTFMRLFAFEGRGTPVPGQSARFVLVNIGSFLQVWTLSVLLLRVVFPAVEFAWQADTVAHVLALGSLAMTSYLAHKHFTFRPARFGTRFSRRSGPLDLQPPRIIPHRPYQLAEAPHLGAVPAMHRPGRDDPRQPFRRLRAGTETTVHPAPAVAHRRPLAGWQRQVEWDLAPVNGRNEAASRQARLCRPSLPSRSDQPGGVAVLPLPTQLAHGPRDAGGTRHRGQP